MLAGSMIRNTNWTRVNAQLVNWTGGESGTRASMANSVGEWTASAGKTVGQMWNNVTSSITSVYENVAGNLGRTVGSSAAGESGQLAKETMSSFGLGKLKQMAMEKKPMTCFPIQFETSYLKKCSDNGWRNSLFCCCSKTLCLH
nr:hypothetical protein [Escherichia coli]